MLLRGNDSSCSLPEWERGKAASICPYDFWKKILFTTKEKNKEKKWQKTPHTGKRYLHKADQRVVTMSEDHPIYVAINRDSATAQEKEVVSRSMRGSQKEKLVTPDQSACVSWPPNPASQDYT